MPLKTALIKDSLCLLVMMDAFLGLFFFPLCSGCVCSHRLPFLEEDISKKPLQTTHYMTCRGGGGEKALQERKCSRLSIQAAIPQTSPPL